MNLLIVLFRRRRPGNRATVSLIAAVGLVPLIMAAGVTIDLARQVRLYRALTAATDAAAIAGATLLSEKDYATDIPVIVNAYLSASAAGMNATVTLPASVFINNGSVRVTTTAKIGTTLASMLLPNAKATVTSVAGGPTGAVTVTATPAATGAADLDTVYLYTVKPNGTKDLSNRTALVDNTGSATYPAGQTVSVAYELGLGERIGFELDNVTGGRNNTFYLNSNNPTAANAYGSTTGTLNVFYSSDYPATLNTTNSTNGYSATNQQAMVNAGNVYFDNTTTACYVYQGAAVPLASFNTTTLHGTLNGPAQQQNVLVNGGCANLTPGSPNNIAPTCLELNGQTIQIAWNDMGDTLVDGDSDRYTGAYADMTYSFSCSNSETYARAVLVQ